MFRSGSKSVEKCQIWFRQKDGYPHFLYSRVEWYTVVLAIFENEHYAADQVYFYEFNSKKLANLALGTRGKV